MEGCGCRSSSAIEVTLLGVPLARAGRYHKGSRVDTSAATMRQFGQRPVTPAASVAAQHQVQLARIGPTGCSTSSVVCHRGSGGSTGRRSCNSRDRSEYNSRNWLWKSRRADRNHSKGVRAADTRTTVSVRSTRGAGIVAHVRKRTYWPAPAFQVAILDVASVIFLNSWSRRWNCDKFACMSVGHHLCSHIES